MEVAGTGRGGDIRVSRTHQTLVVIMRRLHDLAITSLELRSEKIVLFMKKKKKKKKKDEK